MSKKDNLLRKLKDKGIDDPKLRGQRGHDLFDVLASLGVDNPKKQLVTFIRNADETQASRKPIAPIMLRSSFVAGSYSGLRTFAYTNPNEFAIRLTSRSITGTNSSTLTLTNIEEKVDGEDVSLPFSIPPGGTLSVTGFATLIGTGLYAEVAVIYSAEAIARSS